LFVADFGTQNFHLKNKFDMENETSINHKNCNDANRLLAAVNPIIDICGDTIDLRKVERVGKVGGDSSWLRYSVYFTGGSEIEIYHVRKYTDNIELRQMKREKFVELWRSFNGC
jgi:hypothetical protein